MSARLIEIEDGRRVRTTSLPDSAVMIGRDPTCELFIDTARVSRLHASIDFDPARQAHVLTDRQSVNGTSVNGELVQAPISLHSGDRIELAGSVVLLYETGVSPALLRGGLAVVLVLGLIAGPVIWLWPGGDPVMLKATALAAEAVEANRAGDAVTTKERLQAAAGHMLSEGRLDDVPRTDAMRVAMERLGERLDPQVDLTKLLEHALTDSIPAAPRMPAKVCRLDRVERDAFEPCLRELVGHVMEGLRQDPTSVPEGFYSEVGGRIRREHLGFARHLERGRRYRDMIERELVAANMPPLLYYLAMIESGFDPQVRSPAGAVGLWQFMPATAREHQLVVREDRDDRMDPELSTKAAANFLRGLTFRVGGDSLMLALASYNRGAEGVYRALRRLEDPFRDRSYWRLVEADLLPRETAEYVTRFVAAAVAGEGGLPSLEQLQAAGY